MVSHVDCILTCDQALCCAGELHLTPLRGIVQLRPSLAHLDQAVAGRRHGSSAPDPVATDGDTTESEGEEAKPVTVKFARRDVGRWANCLSANLFSSVAQCTGTGV